MWPTTSTTANFIFNLRINLFKETLMNLTINRDILVPAVQSVIGAIERRQTLPILSNLLMEVKNNQVVITATDLEIEIKKIINLENEFGTFEFTLPARKTVDICRNFDEGSTINFLLNQENIIISSNRSKFTLSILPSIDYPKIENFNGKLNFTIAQNILKKLINNVSFAMAQQDVRYYLNGMLFDLNNDVISVVTTDGHRLALSQSSVHLEMEESKQLIIPRKTVIELQKILNDSNNIININIDQNHIQFILSDIILTSKLIDGKFPDYNRVIPTNNDKIAKINRDGLRQALIRSAIISNEKFKGAKFNFSSNLLKIETQNSERENSKEEIQIEYDSSDLSIGFNISYILDIINISHDDCVELQLKSTETSGVIQLSDNNEIKSTYVVMPMRI